MAIDERVNIWHIIVSLIILAGLAACSSAVTPSPVSSTELPTEHITRVPHGSAIPKDMIRGAVRAEGMPIAGAVVRVQTREDYAVTDADGKFSLQITQPQTGTVRLTAWVEGYFIAGPVEASPGTADVVFNLEAHTREDNPDYAWMPSRYHPGQGENQGCAECHQADEAEPEASLPVDEWEQDAHSRSAQNMRFNTMYNGTDVLGHQSPPTRYVNSVDYGKVPIPPDLSRPYYGPGYKLDFPDTDGNCAACHTPAASVNEPYGIDPTRVSGVAAEGISCDFCHKVWDVSLDAVTGLPLPNMPGVLSFEFRRPPEGHQFFAGPFDDVAPGEDTYSPLQQQSQFCAACHYGVFWDTVIYNSFGEWLASPYSDAKTGKTCQDCHMPPGQSDHFVRFEKGGLNRSPETIFSHRMPGAGDEALLKEALDLDVEVERTQDELVVKVTVSNEKTGHDVPTDSPLRQVLLLVKAKDGQGEMLVQLDGPVVPNWGGTGSPQDGYYAGLPGTAYAKILEERWTGIRPTGAYWNPTIILSDNRIPAKGADTTVYRFRLQDGGTAVVQVRLLYRRAFKELMDQKGWNVPDILMAQQVVRVGE